MTGAKPPGIGILTSAAAMVAVILGSLVAVGVEFSTK
jgi:mevalonate kinase